MFFSHRLGAGTDINDALAYCQTLIKQPTETIRVLISDLFEGGVEADLIKRAASLVAGGTQFVALLALSDDGAPAYDHRIAGELSALGVPSFACTPDLFPSMLAAALERRDLTAWAALQGIVAGGRECSQKARGRAHPSPGL